MVRFLQLHVCTIYVTGVFQSNRLIIVITQYDQVSGSSELSDTDEEITEEGVKKQTCQFVHKACPGVKFSPDDVLLVSGRWAYHARMLAVTPPHGPTQRANEKFQATVKRLLRDVPNTTCGQGEDPTVSFDKLGGDELSAKLEEASGIATLEARYFKFHTSKTNDLQGALTLSIGPALHGYNRWHLPLKENMHSAKTTQQKICIFVAFSGGMCLPRCMG